MSIQSHHDPTLQRVTTQSSFCLAIFFFHTCGCRTLEPVFACQPSTHAQTSIGNPCQHEEPTLLVAKLPHACKACGVEDLGAKEFVREVDTAERLELIVSERFKQDKIQNILPNKVEDTFTVDEIISKLRRGGRCRSTFSAKAAPFVPRFKEGGILMGSTMAGDCVETAYKNFSETTRNMLVDDAKVTAEQARGDQQNEKNGSWQDVLAEEMICNKTTRYTKPGHSDDDGRASEKFHGVELSVPSPEHKVPDDKLDSSFLPAEHTVKNESRKSTVEHQNSYEDLMVFWAMDDSKAELKPTRTCYWAITSLLGRFNRWI
ncbi:hypothetical protein F5Y12DRAFT_774130 [Xylaria sp. FL1777]|nr:hypothetical protein F5Y12DRAFT_774130 [Xylaria sp. FL1777]